MKKLVVMVSLSRWCCLTCSHRMGDKVGRCSSVHVLVTAECLCQLTMLPVRLITFSEISIHPGTCSVTCKTAD